MAPLRLPASLRRHALPLGLALTVTVLAFLGSPARRALRLDRPRVLEGELWRLFTGHLVHLGWGHLAMNLAGLALVWLLVGAALSPGRWATVLAVCALGTGLGLALDPRLHWYVGLSGVLHGLLAAGAVAALRGPGRREAMVLLALLAAKLAWEQARGALPGSAALAGGPVLVDAHLYGAVWGGLAGWLLRPSSAMASR